MVAATLSCLSRGGRLAEISKRDIWSPQRVAQERPDVHYQLIAIDFLPTKVADIHFSLYSSADISLSLRHIRNDITGSTILKTLLMHALFFTSPVN